MTQDFWVIRYPDGSYYSPPGVSTAPQLFKTEGKARGRINRLWRGAQVVRVTVTFHEDEFQHDKETK